MAWRKSLIVGGVNGTGASPENGQCELEGRACPAAKDFRKLFATVALAVQTVMEVKKQADFRIHNELFQDPLHELAALLDRVQAALLGLAKIFIESAAAQKALGNPPTRSTVNLRHFSICATVTHHPSPCWARKSMCLVHVRVRVAC